MVENIVKFMLNIDDSLDVFAEHGIGGIVGLMFNAFFGTGQIIGLDGVNTGAVGGFLDYHYQQFYIQLAYILACVCYLIPGLHLRASEEAELLGMDDDQHGEFSYDYVEVRRDFLAWAPHQQEQHKDGLRFTPQHGIEEHAILANGSSTPPVTEGQQVQEIEKGD
jgi:ammonium transporter, Amt family